jgi:hypothetical protein
MSIQAPVDLSDPECNCMGRDTDDRSEERQSWRISRRKEKELIYSIYFVVSLTTLSEEEME